MTIREAASDWLAFEQHVRGCSGGTIRLYRCYLAQFTAAAGLAADIDEAAGIAERFIERLGRRGLSDHARAKAFNIIRAFLRWACERGLVGRNPLSGLRAPIIRDHPRRFPSRKEVDLLLEHIAESGHEHAARDHALYAVMFWAGLRCGEAAQLRVCDLDLQMWTLTICGKGGKLATLPLHAELVRILKGWLKLHAILYAGTDLLFPSRPSHWARCGVLDDCRIARMLHDYARGARVADLTPHALRRAFATELRRRMVPLDHVRRLLRHSKIETTMRYVKDCSVEELRRSVGML